MAWNYHESPRDGKPGDTIAPVALFGVCVCLAVLHGGAPRCCRRLAGRSVGHASSHSAGKRPAARQTDTASRRTDGVADSTLRLVR